MIFHDAPIAGSIPSHVPPKTVEARVSERFAMAPWSCAASGDALSELDEILEGPKLSVREARQKLESLIAWSRSFAPSVRSAQIVCTSAAPAAAAERGYREDGATPVIDAGVVTIRVRGDRPTRALWPLIAFAGLGYLPLLVAAAAGSLWPLVLGWTAAALVIGVSRYPWAHELVFEGDVLRVRRAFSIRSGRAYENVRKLDWLRCTNDQVLLLAQTDREHLPLLVVSRETTQVSVIPAVWAAHRALRRAVGDRPAG